MSDTPHVEDHDFEIEGEGGGQPTPVAPRPSAPRPSAPHPSRPAAERRTASATRRTPSPAEGPRPAPGIPFLLRPGLWIFLGAVLAAAHWIGRYNPVTGEPAAIWPWDLFRARGSGGGSVAWYWDLYRALALAGGVLALWLLVASLLKPGRGRAIFVALAVALALTTFIPYLPSPENTYPLVATLLTGLTAGAAVGRRRNPAMGRGLLLASLLLLAAILFFPAPLPPMRGVDPPAPDAYHALALAPWRMLTHPPEGASRWHALLVPTNAFVIPAFLVAVGALMVLTGIGGRIGMWIAGVFALVAVVAPALALGWVTWQETVAPAVPWEQAAKDVTAYLQDLMLPYVLPLGAVAMDLSRPRPPA